jgi:lipoprotein-releasing system permease protein
MKFGLIFTISKTHLLARIKQSLIAALGVTFGIMMFISLMSFMTGLNGMLDNLILNRTPHIKIYNEVKSADYQPADMYYDTSKTQIKVSSIKPRNSKKEIRNSLQIMDALRNDRNVFGVAPKVNVQAFFKSGITDINGLINGIDVNREAELFYFEDYVVAGDLGDLIKVNNSIILGKGLADLMLVNIGDVVQVMTVDGNSVQMKVVGFYQSGLADFDKGQAFATIKTAQKLLGKPNSYITEIQVKLNDINLAPELAKTYAKMFDTDAIDIQTANAQFETGTNIRNMISYAVSFTLLLVAGFGIYNILNMLIYEKMDDIAILKATGFSGNDVRLIFIFQAMLIGVIGGIAGLIFGYLISYGISIAPFETEALPTIKTFPVNFNPLYYISGIVFALITTFLAGLLPANKAAKIDPVEIIRGK